METTESTGTPEQTTDVASPRHCHLDKHGPTGLEALPTSRPLTPRWNHYHRITALTFKELVASYAAGDTTFTDLEVRRVLFCFCDEEAANSWALNKLIQQLANEFPSMQKLRQRTRS